MEVAGIPAVFNQLVIAGRLANAAGVQAVTGQRLPSELGVKLNGYGFSVVAGAVIACTQCNAECSQRQNQLDFHWVILAMPTQGRARSDCARKHQAHTGGALQTFRGRLESGGARGWGARLVGGPGAHAARDVAWGYGVRRNAQKIKHQRDSQYKSAGQTAQAETQLHLAWMCIVGSNKPWWSNVTHFS